MRLEPETQMLTQIVHDHCATRTIVSFVLLMVLFSVYCSRVFFSVPVSFFYSVLVFIYFFFVVRLITFFLPCIVSFLFSFLFPFSFFLFSVFPVSLLSVFLSLYVLFSLVLKMVHILENTYFQKMV